MNQMPKRSIGVKGADVWADTGSALVDYSIGAVRGASTESLRKILDVSSLSDAFVMAFHVRNIRGGKGERDVFYDTLRILYDVHPELTLNMLEFVPHYGCWGDLFRLIDRINDDAFTERVFRIVVKQLKEDENKVGSISLCAKWAPRERTGHRDENALVRQLAARLFPELLQHSARMRAYRRLVAGLNLRLKTVETLMCGGTWADIDPKSVPGRAGKLYGRALLNLISTTKYGVLRNLTSAQTMEIRRPGDHDRMECREHFQAHFAAAAKGAAVVHGADTLFPHEVVKKAFSLMLEGGSPDEKNQLIAVWRSMVADVKAAGDGLKNCEIMCDFSGSMQNAGAQRDTPYWVSVALGILISEVTGRNRILTFDAVPRWHVFPEGDLFVKIASIRGHLGQGLNTNFQAAYSMIAAEVKRTRPPPGLCSSPSFLLVLTDMNFDAAQPSTYEDRHHFKTAGTQTHAEMGRETFRRLGEDIHGDPNAYPAPVLGIWNLAANPTDFQATANEEGVVSLSGWSATQFKILQKEGLRSTTPLEMLHLELDAPQYDRVRQRISVYLSIRDMYISHANGFGAED